MKQKFLQFVNPVVTLFYKIYTRLIYMAVYLFLKKDKKKWKRMSSFITLKGFLSSLSKFHWRPDALKGKWDLVYFNPAFLVYGKNQRIKWGSDCDDFAMAVYKWAKKQKKRARYYTIYETEGPSKGHAFTVVEIGNDCHLCSNGRDLGKFSSFESAVSGWSDKRVLGHYVKPVVGIVYRND